MFFKVNGLIADELTLQDTVDFHRICNQQFVLRWMDDWKMDLSQVKDLISYSINGYEKADPEQIPFIMAVRTETNQLIGICGFGPKPELNGEVEIAYFIDENFSKRGYMSQIVEKAIEFFFTLTDKPHLSALVDERNIPSKRILMNNQFIYHEVDDSDSILKSHYRLYRLE
ncbi:MAG: GNAT family N-acetyltransferase [Oscillospiraceae bacterium]|nr:GNAT family N-acetyltransferase [Oscillospiraceae bacterium]